MHAHMSSPPLSSAVGLIRSRIPLPLLLLLASLLSSLLFRFRKRDATAGSSVSFPSPRCSPTTIFVSLVGTSLPSSRARALHVLETATFPDRVTVGVLLLTSSARKVGEGTASSLPPLLSRRAKQIVTRWEHSPDPSTFLWDGHEAALTHLYAGETHILLCHACVPLPGWDEDLLDLLRVGDASASSSSSSSPRPLPPILCCLPGPRFPRLHVDPIAKTVRQSRSRFAVESRGVVPCPQVPTGRCLLFFPCASAKKGISGDRRNKAGRPSSLLDRVVGRAGMPKWVTTHECCTACSSDGVGDEVPLAGAALRRGVSGSFPSLGIVDATDAAEAVSKYGSVDAARIRVSVELDRRRRGRGGGDA